MFRKLLSLLLCRLLLFPLSLPLRRSSQRKSPGLAFLGTASASIVAARVEAFRARAARAWVLGGKKYYH